MESIASRTRELDVDVGLIIIKRLYLDIPISNYWRDQVIGQPASIW